MTSKQNGSGGQKVHTVVKTVLSSNQHSHIYESLPQLVTAPTLWEGFSKSLFAVAGGNFGLTTVVGASLAVVGVLVGIRLILNEASHFGLKFN